MNAAKSMENPSMKSTKSLLTGPNKNSISQEHLHLKILETCFMALWTSLRLSNGYVMLKKTLRICGLNAVTWLTMALIWTPNLTKQGLNLMVNTKLFTKSSKTRFKSTRIFLQQAKRRHVLMLTNWTSPLNFMNKGPALSSSHWRQSFKGQEGGGPLYGLK